MRQFAAVAAALLVACLATRVGAVCDPEVCLNATYASLLNVTNASLAYDNCVAEASGVTAFVCRCTPRLFECFVDPLRGNCIKREARPHCWRYVSRQALDCSQKLCISAAPGLGISVVLATALAMLVMG